MATTSRPGSDAGVAVRGSGTGSEAGTRRDATRGRAGSLQRMPADPRPAGAPGSEAFRLPRSIEPETYRLEIEPDVASASFSGTVDVDVVVVWPTDVIVLNAVELAVSDADVRWP